MSFKNSADRLFISSEKAASFSGFYKWIQPELKVRISLLNKHLDGVSCKEMLKGLGNMNLILPNSIGYTWILT